MNPLASSPIGIFDSGLGGLTVLKALMKAFPKETFVYLGDTARLPYGSKSKDTIWQYLVQNISFLSRFHVKSIVVACNSASSVLTGDRDYFPIPIYGVIAPGALLATRISTTGRIGVLGTEATIYGNAYKDALLSIQPDLKVYQQPCPLLVPIVEEGLLIDPLTNLIVHRYLRPLVDQEIDTLILGCTHYPLLKSSIAKVMGSGVHLIDSAQSICEKISEDFDSKVFQRNFNVEESPHPPLQVFLTDLTPHFKKLAQMILPPGTDFTIEKVNL